LWIDGHLDSGEWQPHSGAAGQLCVGGRRGGGCGRGSAGAAAAASFVAAVLTEIYLPGVDSGQEILSHNGCGQSYQPRTVGGAGMGTDNGATWRADSLEADAPVELLLCADLEGEELVKKALVVS
jgi:hypothetical protein